MFSDFQCQPVQQRQRVFEGHEWLFEWKYDGSIAPGQRTGAYGGIGLNNLRPTMTWNLFMWLSDIRFWIRSARSDAQLQRLLREHDNAQSLDLLYEGRKDPWGLDSPI